MNPQNQHFQKKSGCEYEFPAAAAEITILDRRGQIIWRQRRTDESTPIRWMGLDLTGAPVTVGSYMCKILYAHLQQAVYLPFVFAHD